MEPAETVYDLRIRGRGPIREVGDREGALVALAERQYGVVARWQLMDLGFGKRAIERRLASRQLHRVRSGVYAVGHIRFPREGWWMVAVLSCGQSAFRDDRARDRKLRVAGYSVTRLTWNQLDDEPEAVAVDLRALLEP